MKLFRRQDKKHAFVPTRLEIEHRGVPSATRLYWAMLFRPGKAQPHLKLPENVILRCHGSSDPVEFLNELYLRTQPMTETWDGNQRHLGITPLLVVCTSDEDDFRRILLKAERDLWEKGFIAQNCANSWGFGWHCLETQRGQR